VAREWTRGIANLIIDAANWGANIVQSLANGIQGSGAVVNALQDVASQITMWLQPGSPPKLLPDLPEWGAGAIQSWLDGWSINAQMTSGLLKDLRSSLRPFLEQIDLGKELDMGQVEAKFGANAPDVKAYLGAYKKVSVAVGDVQDAREALKKAEAGGDTDAIAAAQKKLKAVEANENLSRRTFYEQEARLAARISAETQITKAIEQQGAVAAKVAGEASNLAEEAKQRAIDQAFLQYRLSVAGTASGQIPIWEEELAKVAEGSAEYWQIQTRLVELRRAVEKQAAGTGAAIGGSLVAGIGTGIAAEADKGFNDSGAAVQKGMGKVDWGGIGRAIAISLWTGLIEWIKTIPAKIVEWSLSFRLWAEGAAGQAAFGPVGVALGRNVAGGIMALFGIEQTSTDVGDAMLTMLGKAAFNIGAGALSLGVYVAYQFNRGLAAALGGMTMEEFGAIEKAARENPNSRLYQRPPGDNASGTDFWRGGLTWVGERGPEIVDVPQGAAIHSNAESKGMTGNTYVTIEAGAIVVQEARTPRQTGIGVLREMSAAGVAF
jgi:hypothetical protein